MAYQPVQRGELKYIGPRPGVQTYSDVVLWWLHNEGVTPGGIYNRRRVRGGTSWSLHAVGRAVDFMVPAKPVGDRLAFRAVAAAPLTGVCEVIWYGNRWTAEKGWQKYNGTNQHLDHVHVGFTIDWANRPSSAALGDWCRVALGFGR
jgi:hypothetical protein